MVRRALIAVGVVCLVTACKSQKENSHGILPDGKPSKQVDAASSQKRVNQLLDEAIGALGGRAALAKLRMCKIMYHGVTEIPGFAAHGPIDVFIEDYFKYPDKVRRTVKLAPGTAKLAPDGVKSLPDGTLFTYVVIGRNAWVRGPGKPVAQLSPATEQGGAWPVPFKRLYNLLEWTERKGEGLSVGDTKTVDGDKCDCIVIMSAGKPTGKIYFDQATHFVKKELEYHFPDFSNPPTSFKHTVALAIRSSDYKTFDGVVVATRVVMFHGTHKVSETRLLNIEFLKTIDEHLFEIAGAQESTIPKRGKGS
jgi:hypothetical protein